MNNLGTFASAAYQSYMRLAESEERAAIVCFRRASDRDVAGGDLVFVGGEGCQNGLLAPRDLDEVQGPSEFRCDLIKFCARIRRSRWASLRPSGVVPGLMAVNW